MVPFDRSHTTSYSPSKATICLSHAVSEIWGDEKNCVDSDNKKLIAMTTSLEGSKKNNFRSFTYSQCSTNPATFVKISQVDVELIDLTEITTNIFLNCKAKRD